MRKDKTHMKSYVEDGANLSTGIDSQSDSSAQVADLFQLPESMDGSVSMSDVFDNKEFVFENYCNFYYSKKKNLIKKFCRGYVKLRKTGEVEMYEDKLSTNKKILHFKIEKFVQRNLEEFYVKLYIKEDKKRKLGIKFLDSLQYGNFLMAMKYLKIADVTKKKSNVKREKKKESHLFNLDFYKKSVLEWTEKDVLEWTKFLIIGDAFKRTFYDEAGYVLKKKKLKGRDLMVMKKEDMDKILDECSLKSYRGRTYMKKFFKSLQKHEKFDPIEAIVTRKVVKMLDKQKIEKSSLTVHRLVKAFSSKEEIMTILKRILFKNIYKSNNQIFRIKLIIVENLRDERQRRLRKFFGKVLAVKDALKLEDKNTKYGLFHVALSIGPLQLEWVDTSIVITRPISSEKALLCVDVANIEVENGMKFVEKLALKIMEWNREYEYESYNMIKTGKYDNCQGFVTDMLKYLGLKPTFSKHINKFIDKRLKREGVCQMMFDYDKKFQKKFKLKNSVYIPKEHESFDEFVNDLFKIENNFEAVHPSEYALLKGFDRAFWMKNLRSPGKFEPAKKTSEEFSGCPFCSKNPFEGIEDEDIFESSESEDEYLEDKLE